MSIYQPESFYETTLTAAITDVQTTISVTTAPNITSGYMVIEANTSNREIILYTGVSAGSLTGVVRGLATYGSNASAGTGKAHAAGVDIAMKDVHYYYAQYYDFLVGTSATGANKMRIGDGNTTSASDRFWYVHTSSISAFWGLSANGQMVISENGVDSYVVSAGGSGVAGSNSVDITAGVASVKSISASALYLSASGLRISAGKLAVNTGQGLSSTSAAELYVDLKHDYPWTGAHTFKTSSVFQSSGSATFDGETIGIDTELFDADEVIVVSSHPKPVKLTSASKVYMCSSGAVANSDPFIGFAITAGNAGDQIQVKTKGLVDGFSGLTTGDKYFLGGQAGEFSSVSAAAVPTIELQLGIAAAADCMFVQKGEREYRGTDSGSRSSTTAAIPTFAITVPSYAKRIHVVAQSYKTEGATTYYGYGEGLIIPGYKTSFTVMEGNLTNSYSTTVALSDSTLTFTGAVGGGGGATAYVAGNVYYFA